MCKVNSIIGEPPAQSAIITELRMRRVDVGRRTIVAVVGASHDLDRFSFFVCATDKVKYAELAAKMIKIESFGCYQAAYLVSYLPGVTYHSRIRHRLCGS